MSLDVNSLTALWAAVILSGIYHGINPGMGWPLAVSAGLMEGKARALPKALGLLALGHMVAMLAILLPFSMVSVLLFWETEIRIGAGILVVAMGLYLLFQKSHPRILARIHPTRLASWSFLAAIAHGAGLMLVPIYLGICAIDASDTGHFAARTLMGGDLTNALTVAFFHTLAMTVAAGLVATGIYFWLGLRFVSRTWFNLDTVWAASLVLVGGVGIYSAHIGH